MSSRTSHASLVCEDLDAVFRGGLGAGQSADLHALLAVDPKADQRADLAAELDRLVPREVAEVRHLHVSLGVLVHGEGVDHPHRVTLPQPFELLDHLTVEVRVAEAQHQ